MSKREKKKVQLVELKEPVAMTLAKLPANRSGFKIIREDNLETADMPKPTRKRSRRKAPQKREDSLYLITLPDGISRDEAEAFRVQFGMEEDYEVYEDDLGRYHLRHKGVDNIDKLTGMAVDMGNGFSALIDGSIFEGTSTRQEGQPGVRLVELQLDSYSLEEAKTWLEAHRADWPEGGVEVVEGGVIVSRYDYQDVDARKLRIGDGVTAVVVRAETNDVPAHLYRAVVEGAYGNYGWGHLDFAMTLADPAYTDAAWDGISALRNVLENVTLYSGLPLDERKRLVDNALNQFGEYYKALIDAMPREAVEAAKRYESTQEATMPKTEDKVELEQRAEDAATEEVKAEEAQAEEATEAREDAAEEATEVTAEEQTEERSDEVTEEAAEETPAAPEYVTADQVEEIVTRAIQAALPKPEEATEEETEQREDATEETAEEQTEARSDEPSETDLTLAEGIATLVESVKALGKRMDGLDSKLDNYGESVEARSDEAEDVQPTEESTKRDVFDGLMGGLHGLRQ